MSKNIRLALVLICMVSFILFSCRVGSNMWTWISGSNTINQPGSYGTQGVPAASNVPGARFGVVSWIDSKGNMWLFGGYGYDSDGTYDRLNDLWKFDGTNWTWISGSNTAAQNGNYGTKGVPAASNVPGANYGAVSWIDKHGNMWLFGGIGLDSTGAADYLNDLWKFDGTNWTWISGSDTIRQAGTYGTQGAPAASNVPGGRVQSVSWIDKHGNMWLFGGLGYDSTGTAYYLNDLWKFDGSNWTWVMGSNLINQYGNYGTKGVPAASNVPGARYGGVSWIDKHGNLWLFGGQGFDSAGTANSLNDLWKFDGTNWIWISGSNTAAQNGNYGTKGVPAASNVPGSHDYSVSWIDSSDNLWLFGGWGFDSMGTINPINDLWKFDGTNWIWVSGLDIVDQAGNYGTKGVPAASNAPGARYGGVSWIDKHGNLWFFGGAGYDSTGNFACFNDLWVYQPIRDIHGLKEGQLF